MSNVILKAAAARVEAVETGWTDVGQKVTKVTVLSIGASIRVTMRDDVMTSLEGRELHNSIRSMVHGLRGDGRKVTAFVEEIRTQSRVEHLE